MASDNGPISVSQPTTSLLGALATQLTFSTRYPFHKLDSTNPVSFQIITLFFNKDTPTPSVPLGQSGQNRTLVYSYPHGYKYTPSSWFLISLDNFTTVLGSEGSWIIGNASGLNASAAVFEVDIDSTNVKFYIRKYWTNNGVTPAPTVLGFFITVRAYIFVEDLGGNGVPTQP